MSCQAWHESQILHDLPQAGGRQMFIVFFGWGTKLEGLQLMHSLSRIASALSEISADGASGLLSFCSMSSYSCGRDQAGCASAQVDIPRPLCYHRSPSIACRFAALPWGSSRSFCDQKVAAAILLCGRSSFESPAVDRLCCSMLSHRPHE